MNKKLLIDRFLSWPLPESLCSDPCASMPGYPHRTGTNLITAEHAAAMIEHVIAAPRQSEGDAISRERVQAEANAFFDWPTNDKSSVTTTSCLIFARCIAGMVAAERDATIAELREECERVRQANLEGAAWVGSARLEIDTLRQQLAERDAEIERLTEQSENYKGQFAELHAARNLLSRLSREGFDVKDAVESVIGMRQQRDKLAGLLREAEQAFADIGVDYWCERIDAALSAGASDGKGGE